MEKLLPCPFCESPAEYFRREDINNSNYWFDVKCTNPVCYLEQGADWFFNNHDEALAMWNNREKNNG